MAEALVAFGIACNVMQVIGCAIDLCHVYHAMSDKGSVDPTLASKSDSLRVLSNDLEQSIKDGLNNVQRIPQDRKRYKELEKIAKDCQDKSSALLQELTRIAPRSQSPFHRAIASGKVLWHGSKIARLEKEMKSYEDAMTSKILVHLFTKAEAAQVQQQADFTQLSDTLKNFIVQYSNGYTKLHDLLAVQSVKIESMQLAVLGAAKETIAKINEHDDANFSDHRDHIASKESMEKLCRSLKYESMNQRKNQINQRYEKTLCWAFSSDSLIRKWLISNGKLFWVTGKAGSGKSTLMKYLTHQPQTLEFLRQNRGNVVILSYYHWSAGGADQSSFHSLLCSLALQVLQANKDTLLLNKNPTWKLKDTPWDWSTEELEEALNTMITSSSYSFCLFIDGLDEFRDDRGATVLVEFLRRLMRLDSVRLLVSSRPEQYFVNKLEQFPKLSMEDMTKQDIAKMVTDKTTQCIEEIRKRKAAAHQRFTIPDMAQLEQTLIEMADGVFIWVHFVLVSVLDGLENDDNFEDLLAHLQNTPRKLEDLYSDMLARTSSVYHQYAGRVFHLVLELPILELEYKTSYVKKPVELYQQTILTYTAILESAKFHSILRNSPLVGAADQIELLCQDAAKVIVTRSAGLVEVKPGLLPVNPKIDSSRGKGGVAMMKVELIHQTARSFLEGSTGKPLLQAGTISKADTYKGLFYSGLALLVMKYVDGYWQNKYASDDPVEEMWKILCLLSPLLPYDEWYPLPLLLYHIGEQCGKYPTIKSYFFSACVHSFYKLVQDLLEGRIQLVERHGSVSNDPQPDFAYEKGMLLAKVVSSALPKQGPLLFIDISTTLKNSVSLIQYLLENGADPNEPQGESGNWGTPVWCFVKRLNHCTNDLLSREAKQRQSGRQDLLIWLAEVTTLLSTHGGNFNLPLLTMWRLGCNLESSFGPPFILHSEPCRLVVFEDDYATLVKAAWLTLQDSSTALQPAPMDLLESLLDQAMKRRPVLVARVTGPQLGKIGSAADIQIQDTSLSSWLGELVRLGYVNVVPIDKDEEVFAKLDRFMDTRSLPHSKEQIQWFDSLVELKSTSIVDETARSAAIVRALEAGQICEPNTLFTSFWRKDEFAFDALSTGLKFFVPSPSAAFVDSCVQKDYSFEKLIYEERDLRYPLRWYFWRSI